MIWKTLKKLSLPAYVRTLGIWLRLNGALILIQELTMIS